jgi:hypothetical protein
VDRHVRDELRLREWTALPEEHSFRPEIMCGSAMSFSNSLFQALHAILGDTTASKQKVPLLYMEQGESPVVACKSSGMTSGQ